jgi:GcrA cell cycle regulator
MASPWTPELEAEVSKLWTDYSALSIAAQFQARGYNFSRSSIIGKIHRLGLSSAGLERVVRRQKSDSEQREGLKRTYNRRPNPTEVQLRCVELVPRHVSLAEIERGECRYPYGDGPFTFCGHPAVEGASYCAPHKDLCWIEPTVRNERARLGRAA